MTQERKLKVRPVPPTAKGGPFRAYVSAQVLEQFGGKSETAAWVLGKQPVPITLWREQPVKGSKQEPLGSNVVQLSETVRQMGRLNLEDPILLLREESAWVPNAGLVVLEETYNKPQLEAVAESETEKQERLSQERENRINRKALQEPAFNILTRNEVAVCGQQIEVFDSKSQAKITLTITQVDGSQAGGLHWVTDETQVEIVSRRKYEMKVPRGRIGGLGTQIEQLDWILADFAQARRSPVDPIEHMSTFVLLTGPSGGGKTALMKAVGRLAWPKVFKMSTDPRSPAKIRTVMDDARHFQRALILIDDLDKIAKPEQGRINTFSTDLLRSMLEIRKDRSVRVLLVAATRDIDDIHPRLREQDGFDYVIRAGLPNIQARQEILQIRLGSSAVPEDAIAEVARRTHAFSGRDLWGFAARWAKITSRAAADKRSTGSSFGSSSESTDKSAKDWLIHAERALKEIRPTTMQGLQVEVPETRFSDIGGQKELKKDLEDKLKRPILQPELFMRFNIRPMKGLLMYGPPGCSKTLMARALATEFRLNFLLVNASELISSYVGESEKRLRELFQQARDASPCILFFDEFETIGAARGGEGSHGGLNIVQTMLTEMDGVKPLENVFVLAATNRPEIIDPAILRPGRLHPHVLIGLPDAEARKEIITIGLRKLPDELVAGDIEEKLPEYAERTQGFTGAQMTEFVEVASRLAIGASGEQKLSAEHFDRVLRTMSATISDEVMDRYREWKA